ncbi:MAG TPA: hypothetical protein VHN80_10830 [Kineosporiaceae bacterium]|nr:hypothetical protein [Kineosporiaceae bacterium]
MSGTLAATPRPPARPGRPSGRWTGPTRPYDLVKEFVAALTIIGLLTVVLAVLFSSPDEKQITLRSWAEQNPNDFVATAVSELAGTSGSATYGPPYNTAGDGQKLGPLTLQKWGGVRIPVDPPNDFVVNPLKAVAGNDAALAGALKTWSAAGADQQSKWAGDYADALGKAPDGDPAKVEAGDFGPVPAMAAALLTIADDGALDAQLVTTTSGFYQTDYSKPILFLGDSGQLDSLATDQHLQGGQWGMMNETGNYPGQAWLWLFSFWYQIPPFTIDGSAWADNADIIITALMGLLSLLLIIVPFVPGLRSIPIKIPLYRLIWRDYYRRQAAQKGGGTGS